MAPTDTAATVAGKDAEDRVAVASNWRLVWWRFRRHHLAMASAGLLIFLYLIVLVPDFFSTQDPERTDARQAFIPVQTVHLFDDGRLSPWVPAIVGKRNPTTLAHGMDDRSAEEGAGALLRAGLLLSRLRPVRDQPASDRRRPIRRSASSCWAPTGWAAISGRASCTARRPR